MKQQPPKSLSPMEYAMKHLAIKDRTVSEMKAYLDGKDFGEADVDATVARLLELGMLNDARYAQRFVETRTASKPISRRHLIRLLTFLMKLTVKDVRFPSLLLSVLKEISSISVQLSFFQ